MAEIIKFPGTNNPKVDEQQKEFAKHILNIQIKMNDKNWTNQLISHKELLILSNHGEAIEHPPQTASRLIAVLATSLYRNFFMEDLL